LQKQQIKRQFFSGVPQLTQPTWEQARNTFDAAMKTRRWHI
jgi:hypothetical protein